ncbi:dTDP-4-dehydrorhamnose reductase [Janthinobacterium sp. KBS0711]|uniref:dTDP-4-dehydrorhamnose reductase n=1 Tax=unclassified Janthinobacterium TaxID=2610881 RepID=UPI0006282860|nr:MULTISPECIES: dTDP-4-dehydrorhamnose reductase [unclassified Janthinobacterium]KKO63671.1 dTDP-4-dehydrorhamnose reductase [Janthinobacterium sp. KBS0711]TSD74196.1 dTDP-4-dehydrorhamnose reductase [Janthinobacterium sp. KBS0711]
MNRILISGKTGQIGYELERSLQGLGEIFALDRKQMDLADLDQVRDVIRRVKPTLIVNPAAYTAVDQAESEPAIALRINGEAPAVMAEEAGKLGAALIHYSTDYVFDGSKKEPYEETDLPCPINVYGSSKLAGETAIQAAGIPYLILRTSWVYSTHGKNFLLTMRRLAQEREELAIVSDQYGAPTWSRTVADTTAHILSQYLAAADPQRWWHEHSGLYHLTAQGQTTWFGLADAIMAHPSITKKPRLRAILARDYPMPAQRPANSRLSSQRLLDTFCGLPQWQDALLLCQDSMLD